MSHELLLSALREAHARERTIDEVREDWKPATVEQAYAIAAALTRDRGPLAGWKIGATSSSGQKMLGLDEPFFGRIFASTVHRAGATLARLACRGRTLALEPEIAFLIGRDIDRSSAGRPDALAAAIEAVAPAIEVNCPAYARPFEVGGRCLIADNGVNAGLVLGAERAPLPPGALPAIEVEVSIDGEPFASGRADAVLGNPLHALAWLADALARRGLSLERGQVVASGALTRPIEIALPAGAAARRLEARFGPLGAVALELTP